MDAVQLALVANPKSGAGRTPDEIAAVLREHGHEIETFTLDDADEAAASGADRVVVAGGDGSIGVVFAACAAAGTTLAVLPAGTANDFARAIGVPAAFDAAVALAADPEARGLWVWGAEIDGRPFVNVASIGLAVNAAEEAAPFKKLLGPVAYALGAAIAAARGKHIQARVTVDGRERFAGDVWQVLVASTGTFGGIAQLPESDPETAAIEAYVVEGGSRLGLLRRVWGMRRGGDRGGVRTFRGHQVGVSVEPEPRWNVDGEVVELGDVTARPLGPVRVIVPRDANGSATA